MAWWEPPLTIPPPGYTVAVLHKASGLSYVAGAPQHKHRGTVFELQEGRDTNFMPVLEGEQVPAGEGHPCCYRWRIRRPQREGDRLSGTQRVGDPARALSASAPALHD